MERGERDGLEASGDDPHAQERVHLVPMSILESWTLTDGDPDVRGWDVRTVSGRQLGVVGDLLVDARAREVVSLDVDLAGTDRHTFVPIRVVHIDRARHVVMMDSADLPTDNAARRERVVQDARPKDAGTVRYPRTDREVVGDRARLADDSIRYETAQTDLSESERRRRARRRIDRMSTGF